MSIICSHCGRKFYKKVTFEIHLVESMLEKYDGINCGHFEQADKRIEEEMLAEALLSA